MVLDWPSFGCTSALVSGYSRQIPEPQRWYKITFYAKPSRKVTGSVSYKWHSALLSCASNIGVPFSGWTAWMRRDWCFKDLSNLNKKWELLYGVVKLKPLSGILIRAPKSLTFIEKSLSLRNIVFKWLVFGTPFEWKWVYWKVVKVGFGVDRPKNGAIQRRSKFFRCWLAAMQDLLQS